MSSECKQCGTELTHPVHARRHAAMHRRIGPRYRRPVVAVTEAELADLRMMATAQPPARLLVVTGGALPVCDGNKWALLRLMHLRGLDMTEDELAEAVRLAVCA